METHKGDREKGIGEGEEEKGRSLFSRDGKQSIKRKGERSRRYNRQTEKGNNKEKKKKAWET